MPYTVSSCGRTIGVTDLAFARIGARSRSGWFHPNAEGEHVMPIIASVLPAMRAFTSRRDVRPDGGPVVQPQFLGSSLFADLAEALQRNEALELALHREDGSVVPTEMLGIQDTVHLLALADRDDPLPSDGMDDVDRALLDRIAEELEDATLFERDGITKLDDCDSAEDDPDDTAWMPDAPMSACPRYQIHVMLAGDDLIP